MKILNFKYAIVAIVVATFTVSCNDDDDIVAGIPNTDFTGTFVQQDQMGRPGINTVFPTTEQQENNFNVTLPSNGITDWQGQFSGKIDALYAAYSTTAGTTLTYEPNVLTLTQEELTTALSLDVLQVAPNAATSYYDFGTGVPLTGRNLSDDVIDISLILLFGGANGDRFSGQDTDGDGTQDLPNLVSDNVDIEDDITSDSFPYLVPADF